MGEYKTRVKAGHVVFKGPLSETQIELLYGEDYRFIVISNKEVHVFREFADANEYAQSKNDPLKVSNLK